MPDINPTPKAPPPTLATIALLPRRRLRDGTVSQSGASPSSTSQPAQFQRGSSRGSTASSASRSSSSSRSSTRAGTPIGRSVKRLRGGAVGGGRNKEDAVEIGDSDDDDLGDDGEIVGVNAADVAASFTPSSTSKLRRAKSGKRKQQGDTDGASNDNQNQASSTSQTHVRAPIPDPSNLPPKFAKYAQSWIEDHPGSSPRLWAIRHLFASPTSASRSDRNATYGMIILNQPITRDDVFRRAWAASALRICADGGANRLFDHVLKSEREIYLPHLIKGDLDSLRPDVRAYYASKGVEIKQDEDQYATDLMKCITEIEERETSMTSGEGEQIPIILMGGLSGRVDQTVHTMSLLHKLRTRRSEVYVLNGESVAWVLDEGSHLIDIDHSTMGQTCGILPVGVDSSVVRTQGLKWDIDCETSMDGLLSTSNHLLPENPAVFLETTRPVMWCIEIKEPLPYAQDRDEGASDVE